MTFNIKDVQKPVPSCIAYMEAGGMLGDHFLLYLHAKWLSIRYDMPLLCYHPTFPFVTDLKLYEKELDYEKVEHPLTEVLLSRKCPKPNREGSVVYIVPYFPEVKWEYSSSNQFVHLFDVDWTDPEFRKIAFEMIAPRYPVSLLMPPKDKISIALHARDWGPYDKGCYQLQNPLKHPPFDYYGDALLKIIEMLPGKQLYCNVFTDAVNPKSVVDQITRKIPVGTKIEYRYRENTNNGGSYVLDDFFSLFHYDILLRPASNFTIVPGLLHDYAIEVFPEGFSVYPDGKTVLINRIGTKANKEMLLNLLNK